MSTMLKKRVWRTSKLKNKKEECDGVIFHSKAEARRYRHLKRLQKMGLISELRLQPKYPMSVNGQHVCTYIGDFEFKALGD